MISSSNPLRPELWNAPAVSSLTNNPALKNLFGRLEDDGAVELLPTPQPRPSPAAAAPVRELVEA